MLSVSKPIETLTNYYSLYLRNILNESIFKKNAKMGNSEKSRSTENRGKCVTEQKNLWEKIFESSFVSITTR